MPDYAYSGTALYRYSLNGAIRYAPLPLRSLECLLFWDAPLFFVTGKAHRVPKMHHFYFLNNSIKKLVFDAGQPG